MSQSQTTATTSSTTSSTSSSTTSSSIGSLLVLATVNFVDAISYMSVAPSLIFYVLSVGGTKEQYGLIMSAFSLASFLGKPVYGIWVDQSGNKFRIPYLTSFVLSILGGMFYFLASATMIVSTTSSTSTSSSATPIPTSPSTLALTMIAIGRILGGLGAGNAALGYAYLAITIPFDQQTRTNSLLSMSRILGMALGPVVNLFLAKIDTTIVVFGENHTLHLNPLNSVGLLLAIVNFLTLVVLLICLNEPPTNTSKRESTTPKMILQEEAKNRNTGGIGRRISMVVENKSVWKAVCCLEIIFPIMVILIVNSSFQLIETALAPAAADGLGWSTVQTSGVLGTSAIVIFFVMVLVIVISKHVSDLLLVGIGSLLWVLGGCGIYFGWTRNDNVQAWHYIVPVMIGVAGFPFVMPSNRSMFSKSVASKAELESMQASMQAVLSMAASVAGFLTPGIVAAYVVRTPEQVDASKDNRELTPWALYSPILSLFILVGLFFLWRKEKSESIDDDIEEDDTSSLTTERTSLVGRRQRRSTTTQTRASIVSISQSLSVESEVTRRLSTEIMGIAAMDTFGEQVRRKSILADLEELKKLEEEMDREDEEG